MRLLFFGSPAVAVPFLEACAASAHEVALVVTQPDKPAGRGMELKSPAVKEAAVKLGLKVLQPKKMKDVRDDLAQAGADLVVVVAFGKMLKPSVLELPKLGHLNVHFSLLPKYRGAAPVQWALMNGEKKSGVTLFWITEGMDEGPVQRMAEVDIGPDEDALELFPRLIALGVAELKQALDDLAAGKVVKEPQKGRPTSAPKIQPELARLDFSMAAEEIHNRVRGLRAGPKPYFELTLPRRAKPLRLTVLKTSLASAESGVAGEILRVDPKSGFLVQCTHGRLWLSQVQPEGKKPQSAADFLNGNRLRSGDRLAAAAA